MYIMHYKHTHKHKYKIMYIIMQIPIYIAQIATQIQVMHKTMQMYKYKTNRHINKYTKFIINITQKTPPGMHINNANVQFI